MKIVYSIVLAAGLLLGASARAESDTARWDSVVLLDVQGLFGGRDLWIAADGKAVCRIVSPPGRGEKGLQETRYEFDLSEEQRAALNELLRKHDFFSIRIRDRPGVPDEARPTVFVTSGARSHAVGKWANDRHRNFDPIYQALLGIADSAKKGEPVHRGAWDRTWWPEGFPESGQIREAAGT